MNHEPDMNSPLLADWVEESARWFRDWGDSDWEKDLLESGTAKLNEHGYDQFGMSPAYIKKVVPIVRFLYRAYFRVETSGLELPPGRVILASNHSGQLPIDGLLIGAAVAIEGNPPRIVRSMVERLVPSLPFVGSFMSRCGQVLGDRANVKRLLEDEEAVLVFPEGIRGISKTWSKRYQLQPFGSGFVRLAMETNTPIVPVGVVGAEEAIPALFNWSGLAKLVGLPSFPITPTFPLVPVLGALPYPVRIRLSFGEPIVFGSDDSDMQIVENVNFVKSRISDLLDKGLDRRERQGGLRGEIARWLR